MKAFVFGTRTDFLPLETSRAESPTQIILPDNEQIQQVSCWLDKTGIITLSGKALLFSYGSDPQYLDLDEKAIYISCGSIYVAIITESNNLYLFGGEFHAQKIEFPNKEKVIKVSCGKYHVGIITDNNRVYMIGENDKCEFGTFEKKYSKEPFHLKIPDDQYPKEIVCGIECTGIITESGELYLCGDNKYNRLCIDENTLKSKKKIKSESHPSSLKKINSFDKPVKQIEFSKSVDARDWFMSIVTKDNQLYIYGCEFSKPIRMSTLSNGTNISSISTGDGYSCIITTDSKVYTWGIYRRQMGINISDIDKDRKFTIDISGKTVVLPTLIESLSNMNAKSVSIGDDYTIILLK